MHIKQNVFLECTYSKINFFYLIYTKRISLSILVNCGSDFWFDSVKSQCKECTVCTDLGGSYVSSCNSTHDAVCGNKYFHAQTIHDVQNLGRSRLFCNHCLELNERS